MRRLGWTFVAAGLTLRAWGATIPSSSTVTAVQSTATIVQSSSSVVQSTAAVQAAPARLTVHYVCPYDHPICPVVACYGSRNYVGCSPEQIMGKAGRVKVTNFNTGKEEVVGRHQIWHLSRLSGAPARDTEVLLACATPGTHCPASDQYHYISCTIVNTDSSDRTAILACGEIIDLFMPWSALYTTKSVADLRDAIPKPAPR